MFVLLCGYIPTITLFLLFYHYFISVFFNLQLSLPSKLLLTLVFSLPSKLLLTLLLSLPYKLLLTLLLSLPYKLLLTSLLSLPYTLLLTLLLNLPYKLLLTLLLSLYLLCKLVWVPEEKHRMNRCNSNYCGLEVNYFFPTNFPIMYLHVIAYIFMNTIEDKDKADILRQVQTCSD